MEIMATDGTKCTLFLLLCSLSLSLSQDVRMPPSLVTGAKSLIIYKEVSKMTLHCAGVGNPAPTYEWTKNGEPLNNNPDNIYQTPGEGTIVIFPCRAADEGYYQCILTNTYGRTMSNMTFLQVASLQSFPPSNGPATYHINMKAHVCLACAKPASIPASSIYWTYNSTAYGGQPILVNQTTRIQTNPFEGKLCLTYVQSSDGAGSTNKMYICNVQNTFLSTIESGSLSKIITTTVTSSFYSAFLTFGSPASLIGLEGEPLVLRCFFSGNPVPTVTWRKNGQTPPQSDWTNEGTGLTLISGRLTRGDGGQFTCTGSTGGGSPANHTIQLTIHARPVFLSNDFQPHDINVTEGDTVTINCDPYAVPNASINWFKNGISFNASALPPKFSLSADNKTLTITNVCKTCNAGGSGDLMNIQCNASNEQGYGFAQGYVNVLVATMIISVGGIREWTPYTNEVFECEATFDDSTSVGRTWYYNDVIVQQSATVIIVANGSLVLLMQNETDGGQSRLGEYRCVVSNGFSEAETIYILGVGTVRMPPSLVTGPTTLIHYKETTNVTLHCVGVGSPTPAYEWTKNGQPLNLNAGNIYPTPGVGTIVIYPCRAADQGYYQCKLSNTFGMAMSNMTFVQMATLQSFPPVIETTNYIVDRNGHVCLACAKLASIPASNIYWTYDFNGHTGQPIVITQTASMQTNPFEGDLCLTHVQETDGAGSNNKTYICNVQNTFLSRIESGSHSMITLTTTPEGSYPALRTFASPSSLIGLEGDPLVLRCFYSGSSIPWINWRKNGQTPPEDRWIVSNEGTGLTLISGSLAADDAGKFTCQGTNAAGSSTHTIQLTVNARPVFLSNDLHPHDINVTEGDTVTIKCDPYAVPNASINWFKDGVSFNGSLQI